MGRKPITINAARLEELARTEPTQLAVALELGMSQKTLCAKLFTHPDLRRAYERGRSKRADAGDCRRPFRRTTRVPAPEPEPPPAPAQFTGPPSERVLAALAQPGGRTFGELMNDTGPDWYQLIEHVNRLMVNGRVVARDDCGKRRHFLAGEPL